jgi:hypothetical protein
MKSKLTHHYVYYVLFLGLISCSPDKKTNPRTLESPLQVEILNSDFTFQKIKDTSELRTDSIINLSLDPKGTSQTVSIAKVLCRGSNFKDEVEAETIIKQKNELQVKNLLPIEIFTPSNTDNKYETRCDFSIDTFLNDKKISITKLKNVKILDYKNYNNLNLEFLSDPTIKFTTRQKINSLNLELPAQEGALQTICENSNSYFYTQGNIASYQEIFNNMRFMENIEHCRFVFRDNVEQNTYVSGDFYIQNENPKIDFVSFELFMETDKNMDLADKTLARIVYRNSSNFKVYFQIKNLQSLFSLIPIYHYQTRGFELGNASQPITFSGQWRLANPIINQEAQQSDEAFYEVMPNESISLELISNTKIVCVTDMVNLIYGDINVDPINCKQNILLVGSLISLKQFPIISFNQYSNLNIIDLQELTSHEASLPIYEQYNYWLPFNNIHNVCPTKNTFEALPETPVRMDMKNPHFYNCRLM